MRGPRSRSPFCSAPSRVAFAGLCYAEMSSTVPISGSAYTYAYATLGELIAWIIGWDLILEYAVGATTVAIGWSGYVVSLARDFGLIFPARFVSSPFTLRCHPTRVVVDRRHPERSGRRGDRRDHVAAGDRHTGVRPVQQFHRGDQAGRHRALYRLRRARLHYGELGYTEQSRRRVHPSQCRCRHLRLVGRAPRRGRGVFCLYRIRRRLDHGAGGQKSDAGPADRHPRVRWRSARFCMSRSAWC